MAGKHPWQATVLATMLVTLIIILSFTLSTMSGNTFPLAQEELFKFFHQFFSEGASGLVGADTASLITPEISNALLICGEFITPIAFFDLFRRAVQTHEVADKQLIQSYLLNDLEYQK
jgi:hypothetical protein